MVDEKDSLTMLDKVSAQVSVKWPRARLAGNFAVMGEAERPLWLQEIKFALSIDECFTTGQGIPAGSLLQVVEAETGREYSLPATVLPEAMQAELKRKHRQVEKKLFKLFVKEF